MSHTPRKSIAFVVGVGLLAAGASAQPLVVSDFDDDTGLWRHDWGDAPVTITWDATMDSLGDPLSGAMRMQLEFDTLLGSENRTAITTDWIYPGEDVTGYTSLEFDYFIDSSSASDAYGTYGFSRMALRNTDSYSFISEGGRNLQPAGGWVHVSIDMNEYSAADAVRALTFGIYGGPNQNIQGTYVIWMDNVQFVPTPGVAALLAPLGLVATRRRR